jgi:hypothetical protein
MAENIIGRQYSNSKGGVFEILSKTPIKSGDRCMYLVRFLNTGNHRLAYRHHITKGSVFDNGTKYTPLEIERIGCGISPKGEVFWTSGVGKHKASTGNGKHTKEYRTWYGMKKRCENMDGEHSSYEKVTVCDRWHNFQNFCDDIIKLEGYSEWKNTDDLYHLDKDLRQQGSECKVYSPETCVFITKTENNAIRHGLYGSLFVGVRILDSYKEEFSVIADFARKYNIEQSNISAVIRGKRNMAGGWKFYKKESLTDNNNTKEALVKQDYGSVAEETRHAGQESLSPIRFLAISKSDLSYRIYDDKNLIAEDLNTSMSDIYRALGGVRKSVKNHYLLKYNNLEEPSLEYIKKMTANMGREEYSGVSPEGKVYYFTVKTHFAKEHGLTVNGISKAIISQKTYKGWTFSKT